MVKNKLIIFDLDGVLIDSRNMHYNALNDALRKIDVKYTISREEHLSTYDGLGTALKLQMLTEKKGLPKNLHDQIWLDKQCATLDIIRQIPKNLYLQQMFADIKKRGYKIAVASNAVRDTVRLALISLGVIEYVDCFFSNQDVKVQKPYPEMYWRCMMAFNALPKNTIIVEDSHIGRQGALDSGAHLLPVEDCADLTNDKVFNKIDEIEKMNVEITIPWKDKKLNVLIPMAGAGTRFAAAGYTFPKPLIEINGKPMIQVVVENLNIDANYIFIVQKEHYEKYQLQYLLNLIAPNCKVIQVDGLTKGAACTTLLAKELINNDNSLVLANSDQYIEWNSNNAMYAFCADGIDGGILTFKNTHPKWSYAKLDDNGFVCEVAEKKPISNNATVGIYYWKHGSDYVKYAEQMIEKNIRTNNEFYVCPVFNEAIQDNKKFRIKEIEKMWGLGTSEDLEKFLQTVNAKEV